MYSNSSSKLGNDGLKAQYNIAQGKRSDTLGKDV